jgi:hypothetical protein
VKQLTANVLVFSILACTVGAWPGSVAPQEQRKTDLVKPESVEGCYELTVSAWQPALKLGEDSEFVTPPHRIQLFAERRSQGFESEGYIVKPAPGVAPSIHRGSYWSPKDSRSIEIVWTTGFSGLVMALKIEGTDLQGQAQTFWDFPRPRQKADVVAHKVECKPESAPVAPRQVDCVVGDGQPKIVAGEGWGPVRIGATFKTVDAFLGPGRPKNELSDVYFKDYPAKGIQISFKNGSDKVEAIFFYNRQSTSPEFEVFCGQVEKGVDWRSSVLDVKRAFGEPIAEFAGSDSGGTWKRIVFAGIDFRFENEKMVRIAIPGS